MPDGRHQQMVRMTASLLVLTALLTTVSGWLGDGQAAQPAMTVRLQQVSEDTYQRTALTAMANQMESYCVHVATRAGYQAKAAVYLTMDGALDHIDLALVPSDSALMPPDELAQTLAQQLQVERGRIMLSVEGI